MKSVPSSLAELTAIARGIRGDVIRMSHRAKAPHLGSALSCVDILVAAYWGTLNVDPEMPQLPTRDRFILSKGHAAAALYAVLGARGFFPVSELINYGEPGSCLPEQPSPGAIPGLEAATGSLGHGLSLGIGMALAARIAGQEFHVVVVMSDGECNEGTVWEAAMFAPAQRLSNVTVVIDFNRWQATGRSEEVMALQPLVQKWRAFGWETIEVDGHDLESLTTALNHRTADRPVAVIANTVKGKGVSFMEDDNNWHYRVPNAKEVESALLELSGS